MQGFNGFPPGRTPTTAVPNAFFSELLPAISDLPELKLTLYCFWALQQQEGDFRYVLRREILADTLFLSGIDPDPERARDLVLSALERAVQRGTLLHATVNGRAGQEELYFINTARGRNALQAIERGAFELGDRNCPVTLVVERPNIFTLYEQHIGPLTPMISDELRSAEQEYPTAWLEEAIRIAVERNKRNWRYVLGILRRWQSEGKDSGVSQRPTQANGRRYIEGELSDFIEY